MGIGPGDAVRVAQPHLRQRLDDRAPRRGPAQAAVASQRLGDLRADPHQGVQGGERVLEDDGDPAAPDRVQHPLGRAEDRLAVQEDPARGGHAGRQQAGDRQHGQGLARAGLPDQPEPVSPGQAEGQVVQQFAAVRRAHREILGFEQSHQRPRSSGSATSRTPSATRLAPITRSTSSSPGATMPPGATSTVAWASRSMCPQEAFGGGGPSPR